MQAESMKQYVYRYRPGRIERRLGRLLAPLDAVNDLARENCDRPVAIYERKEQRILHSKTELI